MARPTQATHSATSTRKAPGCPDTGDFIWLDFRPQKGKEQDGRRCALVLSPLAYNLKTSLCLVCPTTNQAKGYPFEVALPAGFPVGGVVLSDHVKSLDWRARNWEFICPGDEAITQDVLAKIKALISVP
ncbi:MAG: type II toxin-antitoxin system PemK/MazF family toxin [Hyphomicrobiales bacterium]|nr:type II toxin-antitoxin system PemK/MazF family toxin [Hyphomicrobiales bacterium]